MKRTLVLGVLIGVIATLGSVEATGGLNENYGLLGGGANDANGLISIGHPAYVHLLARGCEPHQAGVAPHLRCPRFRLP